MSIQLWRSHDAPSISSFKRRLLNPTDFASFSSASARIREVLGIVRLSRQQAKEVHEAVRRHQERSQRQPDKLAKPNRYLYQQEERVRASVTRLVERLYRCSESSWAGGDTMVTVRFDTSPYAEGHSSSVWSRNGKWRGNDAYLQVTVSPIWRKTVRNVAGLADAGGMLTTHADEIEPGLWQAAWVRQGRGFGLRAEQGYILRATDGSYVHAKTITAAKRIAKQRVRTLATEPKRLAMSAMLKQMSDNELVCHYGDILVRHSDSHRAGNCHIGTSEFVEKHFTGRESAAVREIMEVCADQYTRRACEVAILRSTLRHIEAG